MSQPKQQQQHAPGGHYSGHNPIPTVRQFVDNLDKDKKARDKRIEEEQAQRQEQGTAETKKPKKELEGTEKRVTDPTTGREVVIADVNEEMVSEVENPHVVVPNANLDKQTVRSLYRIYNPPLTASSPLRQTHRSRLKTINTTKMSLHRQIQSPRAPRQMFPSTARRQTSSSTPHLQSAMSQCSKLWRCVPTCYAQAYL